MEFGWINFFGLAIVTIMLIPNIIYAMHFRNAENKCTNKVINFIEQIGRFASLFLMFFPLGIWKFGFPNVFAMLIYAIGDGTLLLAYLIIWVLYFKKQSLSKAMALAIIPTCIFLISGLTLHHWFLVIAAITFGVGHTYVTYQNNISLEE